MVHVIARYCVRVADDARMRILCVYSFLRLRVLRPRLRVLCVMIVG